MYATPSRTIAMMSARPAAMCVPFSLDTHGGPPGFTTVGGGLLATAGASHAYQSRMDDDVRRLLQQRKYDQALEALLDAYGQKVLHMAAAILRDAGRAEEVTQEVFLKIW